MKTGFRVKPLSRNGIDQKAQNIHKEFGIQGFCDIISLLDALVSLGYVELAVLSISEWKQKWRHIEAFYNPPDNTIYVREDIYEDACDQKTRARFTIAHELGHYFLHKNQPALTRFEPFTEEHKIYEDSEWQANYFAGALLVPKNEALQCDTIEEIAHTFKISLQAASIRWKQIHKKQAVN